ncbi:GNAT family N-acetyltransferase [Phytoactinopolyspora mesophila]|uniref:GNAT family N-acetyltransferase n=1 Tax=Phytoactinopolyspora mesophila TaxID=2650750 RepID=UPI001C9E513A
MTEPLLRTERMALRQVTRSDVDRLVLLNNDDGVMRYLDWRPPTREQVVAEVEILLKAYEVYPRHGQLIAELADSTFVGWFSLAVGADGPAAPELGYRLRTAHWGAGLATEGSQAMINYAFAELEAERVVAETMFVNAGSRRVMEKCGMRHIETFHVEFDNPLPGTELGEVRYQITREEWLVARTSR